MKLLYLNEHLSCLNYQMNSDVGFSCQQLEENEVYRIDNSRSSCTLFMIEGEVIFDLGKYKGLRILQNQMVFIPQGIGTRMKSIICWNVSGGKAALQTYAFAETAGAALGAEGLLYKERTIGVFFRIDWYSAAF